MNKIAILTTLMWLSASAYAQIYHPIVETGKVWSAAHTFGNPWPILSDHIKFEGDTSINNLVYQKVWRSIDEGQTNWLPDGFIREDGSKHVYYLSWAGGAPNNLIYDFGAATGDTVMLFSDPMGVFFIVDSVDTASLLNGESRKRMHLACFWAGGGFSGYDTWIEGIGSLYGVLQSGSCALVGDNSELLCFHENDTLKYFNSNYSSCFVITGKAEQQEISSGLKVCLDPTSGTVTIRVDRSVILPLEVIFTDPAGRLLIKRTITTDQTTIDIAGPGLPPVVIYSFIGADGIVSRGKILVLN